MSKRYMKKSAFVADETGPMKGLRSQIAADIRSKYGPVGDLVDIFVSHIGEGVDKWHHYLPLYEKYLSGLRNRPVRFLEIGVSKGGSLEMWREYFGPSATIFGIDIDPSCVRFNGLSGQVRIGSQADSAFLNEVVDEMGGVDVVIDDGSHMMKHVRASLLALFPRLALGGTYIVEDLHTAYWKEYGGGISEPPNFFNMVRELVDDVHSWYHESGVKYSQTANQITGIHIHDSMVIIDKNRAYRPVRSFVNASTN